MYIDSANGQNVFYSSGSRQSPNEIEYFPTTCSYHYFSNLVNLNGIETSQIEEHLDADKLAPYVKKLISN